MELRGHLRGGILALLLAASMAAGPASAAEPETIFAEGFEGTGPLANWTSDDTDSGAGLDSWGRTSARVAGGARSVWCAQNGTNSASNQSNALLRRYDAQMDTNLVRGLGSLSAYRSAQLSFSFWTETDPLDARERLSVWGWDGSSWILLWLQGVANSSGWKSAVAPVPVNTSAISFNFRSGLGLPVEEGVYLDEVRLVAERKAGAWWPTDPLLIIGIAAGVAVVGSVLYLAVTRRKRSASPPPPQEGPQPGPRGPP